MNCCPFDSENAACDWNVQHFLGYQVCRKCQRREPLSCSTNSLYVGETLVPPTRSSITLDINHQNKMKRFCQEIAKLVDNMIIEE